MKKVIWKKLTKVVKFIKYRINRKLGVKLQDIVDDLYEYCVN